MRQVLREIRSGLLPAAKGAALFFGVVVPLAMGAVLLLTTFPIIIAPLFGVSLFLFTAWTLGDPDDLV